MTGVDIGPLPEGVGDEDDPGLAPVEVGEPDSVPVDVPAVEPVLDVCEDDG